MAGDSGRRVAVSPWSIATGSVVGCIGCLIIAHLRDTRRRPDGSHDEVAAFWSVIAVATCAVLLFGQGMQAFDVRFEYFAARSF